MTDAAKTDKGFICEKTFEGAEGEEGVAGGGGMILLFDDGGDKIVDANAKGHSIGKFGISKIWVTDLTGMEGTRVDKFNSIDEALLDLASKGPGFSPIFSSEGIEVALIPPNDNHMILIQKYRIDDNNVIQKVGPATNMQLEEFKENWNKYANSGISIIPTTGWVDNT